MPQAYANNLVDHHLIQDLIPPLARAYFAGRVPATLSYTQAAILLSVGLQQHDISKVGRDGESNYMNLHKDYVSTCTLKAFLDFTVAEGIHVGHVITRLVQECTSAKWGEAKLL